MTARSMAQYDVTTQDVLQRLENFTDNSKFNTILIQKVQKESESSASLLAFTQEFIAPLYAMNDSLFKLAYFTVKCDELEEYFKQTQLKKDFEVSKKEYYTHEEISFAKLLQMMKQLPVEYQKIQKKIPQVSVEKMFQYFMELLAQYQSQK